MSPAAKKLKTLGNENVGVFFSTKTFEWDLVVAGNWDVMVAALERLKPKAAKKLVVDHGKEGLEERAKALLAVIRRVKGPFAQALLEEIRSNGAPLTTPGYLADAIRFAADPSPDNPDEEEPDAPSPT